MPCIRPRWRPNAWESSRSSAKTLTERCTSTPWRLRSPTAREAAPLAWNCARKSAMSGDSRMAPKTAWASTCCKRSTMPRSTWRQPCRAMEPHFDRIAQRYAGRNDVLFYSLNCDDDEALVIPYLEGEKPKTTALFADGLDKFLQVYSFPTTLIMDRAGKISFRTEGFDYESVEKLLTEAIERTMQSAPTTSPTSVAAKP